MQSSLGSKKMIHALITLATVWFFWVDPVYAEPRPPCIDGLPCQTPSGPTPYDLSRFDIPFDYSWPVPPQTSQTINVQAGSMSSLQQAVSTPGARVIVPAGSYVGNLNFADNVEIVASNGARWVLTSNNSCNNTSNVSWTGGVIDGSNFAYSLSWFNCNDWLIDNVRFDDLDGLYPFNGNSANRFAMVNSTGRFTNYAWFSLGAYTGTRIKYRNAIIANCDFEGGYPSGAESTVRWQRVENGIIVDSRLWNGAKHSFRTHYGSRNMFIHSTQLEGGSLQAHYPNGSGTATELLDDTLGAHYSIANTYYRRTSGGVNIQRGPNGSGDFDGPVIIRDNSAYHPDQSNSNGEAERRFPQPVLSGDISANNIEYPFRTPPQFNGGADH
ncbi:MAG: hypothetical protein ACFHXK_12640 [bacterium]